MKRSALIAALMLGFGGQAWPAEMSMSHGSTTHGKGKSAAEAANAAAMQAMMKDMDAKATGNPDADFVRMMLPHHQGAVAMAKVELQYGKDPTLRSMAESIIAAQEAEIAQMKGWVAAH